MKLDKAINLIKQFEGLKLEAYQCSAGVWTIGYGTTKYPSGGKVQKGDKCTLEAANTLLQNDVECFSEELNSALDQEIDLNENEYAALLSLCYNIGITNFKKSTLLKKLSANDFKGAADQFLVWNKAGGKVVKGLENRRKLERELFLS